MAMGLRRRFDENAKKKESFVADAWCADGQTMIIN